MHTPFSPSSVDDAAAARCNRLLVLIVALIALQPFFAGAMGRFLVGIGFVALIGQGAIAVTDHKHPKILLRVLGGLAVLGLVIHTVHPLDEHEGYIFVPALLAVFVGYVCWTLLGFVLRGHARTRTRLSAALCVYLLAGLAWAMAYVVVFLADPGSFSGEPVDALQSARATDGQATDAFPVFTYLSYITLTTLGYGDITPVSSVARTHVMLEAIGGVLFIAVMVASLVGTRDDDR